MTPDLRRLLEGLVPARSTSDEALQNCACSRWRSWASSPASTPTGTCGRVCLRSIYASRKSDADLGGHRRAVPGRARVALWSPGWSRTEAERLRQALDGRARGGFPIDRGPVRLAA